jgi:hypothetical protein
MEIVQKPPCGGMPYRKAHDVPEGLEVALERLLAEAAGLEGGHVILVAVQPLPARDHLEPAEDQVGAERVLWANRIGMRVEQPFLHRIADHEDEGAALLDSPPLADPALVRRRQVRLADDLPCPSARSINSCASAKSIHSVRKTRSNGITSFAHSPQGADSAAPSIRSARSARAPSETTSRAL